MKLTADHPLSDPDKAARKLVEIAHTVRSCKVAEAPTNTGQGVDLFLHQQGLDTSTTAGKAMFQMLGVFAEFERGIIRERVNAGLARARQNGTKLGRRRVKPSVEATIRELRAKGDGILKIAKTLGVGTSVVQRVVLETG
jgi:DNA invertase Pin-like site-specific DNA recombinase